MSINSSSYPKFNYIADKFDVDKLILNEQVWENTRGFIPKYAYYYPKRGNTQLALPVFSYFSGQLLCYQLRDIYSDITNFDSRYSVSKKLQGSLFKPDEYKIKLKPIILESLYEAALLRIYGLNACATMGVKPYRMRRVIEIFQDMEEDYFVIGDNDRSGQYFRENLGGFPLIFDSAYKDLNEFYKHDLEGFEKYVEFLYEMSSSSEDSYSEELARI